jgi:hypothetical protein
MNNSFPNPTKKNKLLLWTSKQERSSLWRMVIWEALRASPNTGSKNGHVRKGRPPHHPICQVQLHACKPSMTAVHIICCLKGPHRWPMASNFVLWGIRGGCARQLCAPPPPHLNSRLVARLEGLLLDYRACTSSLHQCCHHMKEVTRKCRWERWRTWKHRHPSSTQTRAAWAYGSSSCYDTFSAGSWICLR